MRISRYTLLLAFLPAIASAQDRGDMALNMGRGLGSGMSVGWTFKDNWTLQPTVALGYSDQAGFRASLGGTVLRSIGWGHRVYGYAGAGIYYGSVNTGYVTRLGGTARPGTMTTGTVYSPLYSNATVTYVTTPVGLRARLFGNLELFAESAYQRTLAGEFGPNQVGQWSGNSNSRFGATLGITMRLQ
ncbi:MAG: hypothetical protein K1Y01_13410 [Vicinamibacteria bacterium]|nr:hypothetical protein [Vicinamibacteria bacterium]